MSQCPRCSDEMEWNKEDKVFECHECGETFEIDIETLEFIEK